MYLYTGLSELLFSRPFRSRSGRHGIYIGKGKMKKMQLVDIHSLHEIIKFLKINKLFDLFQTIIHAVSVRMQHYTGKRRLKATENISAQSCIIRCFMFLIIIIQFLQAPVYIGSGKRGTSVKLGDIVVATGSGIRIAVLFYNTAF